jgi:hypothetical protein
MIAFKELREFSNIFVPFDMGNQYSFLDNNKNVFLTIRFYKEFVPQLILWVCLIDRKMILNYKILLQK